MTTGMTTGMTTTIITDRLSRKAFGPL